MWSRSAYLIEGVRLDTEWRLMPLVARPTAPDRGYFGRDGREIFNAELADAGFVTRISRPGWGAQIAPRHRLALVLVDAVEVEQSSDGVRLANLVVSRLADLVALTHGGAPRVVGGVNEISEDGGNWRTLAIMAGGGPWPGSKLEKLATDADNVPSLSIAALWSSLDAEARAPLWLSLHRGIAAEPRWDARVFRLCSLLETIGREVYPRAVPVVDPLGHRLHNHGGQAATTSTARGVIYMLLRHSLHAVSFPNEPLRAHPDRTLWDEVGIWVDVRNAVAHEGMWSPPPLPSRSTSSQRRTAEAFELAGRGDGLESGWIRYEEACAASAELVLRAAVLGHLRNS